MLHFFCGISILMFSLQALSGGKSEDIIEKKRQAIVKLDKRKKGFESYLKGREEWQKKRLSVAYRQKGIRKKYKDKKVRAREKFVRTTQTFPVADHRAFLKKRQEKRQKLEKARSEFGLMQKELRKIFLNQKYRISGKREFKL